jgi:hypothetical protein
MVQISLFHTDVNILGGSVYSIKKNRESLLAASKEIGLEIYSYTDNAK